MPTLLEREETTEASYVSTGQMPSVDLVQKWLTEAHQRYKSNSEGENSQVYPALARVPNQLFGLCLVETNGKIFAVGESDYEFSINERAPWGRKSADRLHHSQIVNAE